MVYTFWQLKMKLDQAVVSLLIQETCGDSVVQKARIGTAIANHGPKVKASLECYRANWSGENVSFFLEDWELTRVALGCHIALDLLCQEMHEAWLLGCCCQRGLRSQRGKPFSHRGRAVTGGW